jgi:hypothetical protein
MTADEILTNLCKNTQADYGYEKLVPEETDKAKEQLYKAVMEVIGQDFSNWGELETEEQHDKSIENQLRQTQRQRANKLFGIDK